MVLLAQILGQHQDREVRRDYPRDHPREQHAVPTIQKIPPAYSPVVDFANPIGMKAQTVTRAPVSRGMAVAE